MSLGIEEGVITASTVYNDVLTDFGGNYTPSNYNGFKGYISVRSSITTSQNIPSLKIMRELGTSTALEYLNAMGVTSVNKEEDSDLSLAIGGTTNGATPLEMAAAYGTIANGGIYITPTFYSKVVDSDGNTVLLPEQEQTRVFSEETAYIVNSILMDVVDYGTATYCSITGIDTAAKTGSTNEYYDRWLVGYTPYYAAACWYGYDTNETVRNSGNPAGTIWSAVMDDIHEELPNATFNLSDENIVSYQVCSITGELASTGCTDTYYEIFTTDNLPGKCQGHGVQTICTETGLLAGAYCTSIVEQSYGGVIPKETLGLWTTVGETTTESYEKIIDICTVHTEPVIVPEETVIPEPDDNEDDDNSNTNNNTTSGGDDNTTNNNTSSENNTTENNTNTDGNTSSNNTSTDGNTSNNNNSTNENSNTSGSNNNVVDGNTSADNNTVE